MSYRSQWIYKSRKLSQIHDFNLYHFYNLSGSGNNLNFLYAFLCLCNNADTSQEKQMHFSEKHGLLHTFDRPECIQHIIAIVFFKFFLFISLLLSCCLNVTFLFNWHRMKKKKGFVCSKPQTKIVCKCFECVQNLNKYSIIWLLHTISLWNHFTLHKQKYPTVQISLF